MINYIYAGSDSVAATVLEGLIPIRKPEMVITRQDAQVGRKRELRETVVAELAREHGIKVVKANDPTEALEFISDSSATRGIVVSYGAILKDQVLESLEWFNLHFSLLPKLRGAAPVQRAILRGEFPTGVTLFKIDEGMDTGPIFSQKLVDIDDLDTHSALQKMAESSIPLAVELLNDQNPDLSPQTGTPSHAGKLRREECELDFSRTAVDLLRVVRAAYPEPVAWTTHLGQPLRIIEANSNGISFPEKVDAGTVELVGGKVYVVCEDSTRLELLRVQPFSKKPMNAKDWFNGIKEARVGN